MRDHVILKDRSGFKTSGHARGQGASRFERAAAALVCEHFERPATPPVAVRRGYETTSKMINRGLRCLVLATLFLGGCAMLQRGDWPQDLAGIPPQREIASVPFFPQEEYQCGPAALAMVLAWSGLAVEPAELTEKVYTASLKGSLQPAMIAGARRSGRLAYVISGTQSLMREIAAGHPVIVLQNLGLSWIPFWHYAVAIGYDTPADEVILHSGLEARKRTALRVFENTWARAKNWGLLVLTPGEFPATAEEGKFVEALIGLEKAKQPAAAVVGYSAALSRWPENMAAIMGLGNSYYALGDLRESEAAFHRAVALHPDSGAAWNNLADVLLRQGQKSEALDAARKAIALGGPEADTFQKTLEEIQAAGP
jgi:tetratricopeptide (TPR) repeat protein